MQFAAADPNDSSHQIHRSRELSQPVRANPPDESAPTRLPDGKQAKRFPQGKQNLVNLISHLPGMVYRYRHDGLWTMEFVSEGCLDLTGYQPAELIQNKAISYGQLVHPADMDAARHHLLQACRERKTYDIVYRIITREGSEKWVRETGRCAPDPTESVLLSEGFITDISDLMMSEKRIERQVKRFEALRRIDMAITASFDLRVTLDVLLEQVLTHLGVDATGVLLFDTSTQMLEHAAWRGFPLSASARKHIRMGEGLAGSVALERRTVYISNALMVQEELGSLRQGGPDRFSTYIGVPLIAKGQLKGILEVFHRARLEPDAEWMDFLEALAGQAAIAIDNATLFEELQRSSTELNLAYDATLEGWSKALELRDQETEGHTQRVTHMSLRLARAVGVKDNELVPIYRGALLHDIGKMGIPDRILLKPGPLTPEEWQVMRQHPVHAYKLLSPIPNLRQAVEIPYCHHEKWNGQGYPRGLKGEQIPLAARIFAVVDVYDALTSDRPYRKAWPEEQAFEYIREESGSHFDPHMAKAFLDLFHPSSTKM